MTPKVFFVHVMKTAGTSVGGSLRALYDSPDQIYPARGVTVEKIQINKFLGLDDARRRVTRLVSVHMPAWVADTVGPDFVRVTVLREPVARTISHLHHISRALDLSPDEIYDDPDWHDRLTNYQTRIFSLTEDDHAAQRAAWEESLRVAAAADATPVAHDELAARTRQQKQHVCSSHTAIARTAELGADDLARAKARIDAFDVVGCTEDLESFHRDLSAALHVDLPSLPHRNRSSVAIPISADLRARIVAEHSLDDELYRHVRRRASPADRADPHAP